MHPTLFILTYFQVFSGISRYFQVFQCIFRYFHIFSGISRYFQVFQCISRYLEVFSGIFWYFQIFSGISSYFRVFSGIFTYFQVFPSIGWVIYIIYWDWLILLRSYVGKFSSTQKIQNFSIFSCFFLLLRWMHIIPNLEKQLLRFSFS